MEKWINESKVMHDLEERRAEHAKKMEGLSIAEKTRLYNEAGDKAAKEMGLNLPKAERRH